jgi:hypothetical protein
MRNVLIIRYVVLLLAMLAGSNAAMAQYDPENPPEPSVHYKVKVGVSPAGAGYASGAGSFLSGEVTHISTSKVNGYDFLYWTKNGEQYTTSQSFDYTVGSENVEFVAVYEYNPDNPGEPSANYAYRLYLDCTPSDACSFNRTSGEKTEKDSWVSISATANQDFDFLGWYESGTLISSEASFQYRMKAQDCWLVAKFRYNPANPDDPVAQQDDVDNPESIPGDINGDGVVDITDAVALINRYLAGTTASLDLSIADLNNDGVVDITDAVAIVNKYLKNE